MNVTIEVLTIAIGTAIMAALIVAADWDLAVIQAWQSFSGQRGRSGQYVESPVLAHDAPTPWLQHVGRDPRTGEAAWSGPTRVAEGRTGAAETGGTEADEWLAAAAAQRVRRLRPLAVSGISTRSDMSSPDAQDARGGERPVDANAA